MAFLKIFSPGLFALVMSFGVTAGSLYVTVSTAVSNEAAKSIAAETSAEASADEVDIAESILAAASIALSEDGSLIGRLSDIEAPSGEMIHAANVSVTLSSYDGMQVETKTGADGTFSFGGLQLGVYTITTSETTGGLSYGFRLVRGYDSVAAHSPVPVAASLDLQIDPALAPDRDDDTLDDLIARVTVREFEKRDSDVRNSELNTGRSGGPAGDFIRHDQIALNSDGSLDGQVALLNPVTGGLVTVTDLEVSFIAANEVVATSRVNPDGTFTQHNLLPGIYTMVVAGLDGLAYVGVDIVGGFAELNKPGQATPTATRVLSEASIGLVLGAGADGSENGEEGAGVVPPPVAEGVPPGNGSFGGAGGAPGEGGFGGLLGLAIGAGIGAALANDGGNRRRPATPGN